MFPSKTAAERRADAIVHAIGLAWFVPASTALFYQAAMRHNGEVQLAIATYILAGFASLGISMVYHLAPLHDLRPALRRWDHAAIYLAIAGTFSPLLVISGTTSATVILALIWSFAVFGMVFKLRAGEIDTKWSLISYLGLGAFALVALPDFWAELPHVVSYAIAAGGLFYIIGTQFYRRKTMRFRYPIWHSWGTFGAASFFAAIWLAVTH